MFEAKWWACGGFGPLRTALVEFDSRARAVCDINTGPIAVSKFLMLGWVLSHTPQHSRPLKVFRGSAALAGLGVSRDGSAADMLSALGGTDTVSGPNAVCRGLNRPNIVPRTVLLVCA